MNIHLKSGKDKLICQGHPWVFSGAVARVDGNVDESDRGCTVYDASGRRLGVGYYNDKSAICVRMLALDPNINTKNINTNRVDTKNINTNRVDTKNINTDRVDTKKVNTNRVDTSLPKSLPALTFTIDDLRQRIHTAASHRTTGLVLIGGTDSCRIVNSEGDFLPGLIVDKYASGLCVQIGTAGMECYRMEIINALASILAPAFIYERSDTESRRREGLSESEGPISGSLPDPLVITENGVHYHVSLSTGQKTGFFFDQRENRALLRRYSAGRSVCDCFSYSGGFALSAALGGAASVIAVDSSAEAGRQLSENARLNGVSVGFAEADIFSFLRQPPPGIDLLVLDPPKFARHAGEVDRAARGYKDINLAGMRALAPGGLLFTFSCSGAVDPYLFRQIAFAAAADAGRRIQILHTLTAGPDHPVNIAHREGEYLKGLVLRVD